MIIYPNLNYFTTFKDIINNVKVMDKIVENIKKFRELKNLTRDEVAEKLEMSLSGYSKLERGDVELTVNKLYRIS